MYNGNMTVAIDTLQASEILKRAGFKVSQTKALIKALSPSAEQSITQAQLEAAVNKLKAELIVWMVGLHIASLTLLLAIIGI